MAEPDLKNLTKKERKEYTKQLRVKQESSGSMKGNFTKLAIFATVVIVIGGLIFIFTRPVKEKLQVGETIAEQGASHIDQGSDHPLYNSNPPTSGPHWSSPAECKIYTKEIPDESVLHSLEHGAVWVSYKDKDNKKLAQKLTDLINSESGKLVLSPRSKNDSVIAVASWGRLMKLEEFDGGKISEFIDANKNQSPEPFASC